MVFFLYNLKKNTEKIHLSLFRRNTAMPMSYLLMFHFIKDLICQCDARVLNQILVNSREGKGKSTGSGKKWRSLSHIPLSGRKGWSFKKIKTLKKQSSQLKNNLLMRLVSVRYILLGRQHLGAYYFSIRVFSIFLKKKKKLIQYPTFLVGSLIFLISLSTQAS